MLHRWGCPNCKYVVWAPNRSAVAAATRDHLVDHHKDRVTTLFRTQWSCPRCSRQGAENEMGEAVDAFADHLLGHEADNIVSDVGFFDAVEDPAATLMATERDATAIDYIRRRTISGLDGVVFVTRRPRAIVQFLTERASTVPPHVVIITPQSADPPTLAEGDYPFRLVQRTPELALEPLGATISETIQDYDFGGDDVVVDFELLGLLDDSYGSKRTFEFLHLLVGILQRCSVSSVFAVDTDRVSRPTVNVYGSLFELAIHERNGRYTIVPSSKLANKRSTLAETA